MKRYYFKNEHLYTQENYTAPFMCPVEVIPLKFSSSKECIKFLIENKFRGTVVTLLNNYGLHSE